MMRTGASQKMVWPIRPSACWAVASDRSSAAAREGSISFHASACMRESQNHWYGYFSPSGHV